MESDPRYLAITEASLDVALTKRLIDLSGIPNVSPASGIASKWLDEETVGYACGNESSADFFALIDVQELAKLKGPKDLAYSRIARVLKSARTPPVHLPRPWAEFHHENFLSFFAEAHKQASNRWVSEIDANNRCIRFLRITDTSNTVDLLAYQASALVSPRASLDVFIREAQELGNSRKDTEESFVKKLDLSVIGDSAITGGQGYDDWLHKLSDDQRRAVMLPSTESLRIIGPAGTGKTLTLCMRAVSLAKDETIVSGNKKILAIAHSWAMAERIDQTITTLNYGEKPDNITVFPLLSVIQLHANSSMGSHYTVLGDDSEEGSRRVMEILERVLREEDIIAGLQVSDWIKSAYLSSAGSSAYGELVFDTYEEITSVIAAQNIFPEDNDKISLYLSMERDDHLPPFDTRQDRLFCLRVFEHLISRLTDRGMITTDQLILDAIRVFETFSWNVRRQTEGYDYILVDELQLFGPLERLAISLLARTRTGFAWAAAEDPSQGVFSSLYGRDGKSAPLAEVYLNNVHRFNSGIFAFVQFIYGRFALNVPALKIARNEQGVSVPMVITEIDLVGMSSQVGLRAVKIVERLESEDRLAVIVIGEIADQVTATLAEKQLNVIQLRSFDDIERLSYQRRAIVVSPWQFIGGTQFTHVLLVFSEAVSPRSSFARIRELTAVYLGASRASDYLEILCGHAVPQVLRDALDEGVLQHSSMTS